MTNPMPAAFAAKISVAPATGCHLWTGAIRTSGYGAFHRRAPRRVVATHRFAWELARGPIPDGMLVCHRCDVRHCVNPDHLFLGTHAENSADMKKKAREARGQTLPQTKLTADEVLTIRGAWNSGVVMQKQLAQAFGVHQSQIHRIISRKDWKHL